MNGTDMQPRGIQGLPESGGTKAGWAILIRYVSSLQYTSSQVGLFALEIYCGSCTAASGVQHFKKVN